MIKFSSLHIQNEVLTLTSENPSSVDQFERKSQDKIYPYEKSTEKPEEELIPLTKSDRNKLHSEIKTMNEHVATFLTKLHDKSDKKIDTKFQIADISSKLLNYEDRLESF